MEMDQYKEHHLPGAYIGTLVKHLTSPTTMNPPKDLNFSDQKGLGPERHKKQVRRRLHTTRPYQERLVNMAEARKEIVTALKYHRASMKQAQQQPHPPSPTQPCFEPEANIKSGRDPRSNSPFPPSPNDLPYPWPAVPNFTLPNHLLGLNHINPSSICSSPSSSCSPILSLGAQDSVATISQDHHHPAEADRSGGGLHQAMDDEEMAEIRSIGEQHEMEWNDAMNSATSAWWFKFFKEEEEEVCITDEVMQMQFPSCLNPTETLQDPALPW